MQRVLLILSAALLTLAAGVTPVQAQADDELATQREAATDVMEQIDEAGGGLALDDITRLDDLGPNPWLSFTEKRDPEAVKAWTQVAAQLPDHVQIPRGKANIGGPPLVVSESEAVGEVGVNDTPETGDMISRRFGTRPGEKGVVTINGSLSGGVIRDPIPSDCEYTEDDGSIPLANATPAAEIQVALCVGVIGDGPYGETSGDIDFYSYGFVEEGTVLILDTWHISNSLDPVRSIIGIYDADGNLLVSIEDGGLPGDDPWIEFIAPATGEYFAAIAGCCELSSDPTDSASGPGVGDTGTYELFVVAFPPPCMSSEDDGSIGLANDTNVNGNGFDFCSGIIGDGPWGSSDSDFYSLGTVEAGAFGYFDVFAFEEPMRSVVGLYNSAGDLLASYEDTGDPETSEEFLEFEFTETDDYYLAVSGCCDLPADPNDPSSGIPSDESGSYEVIMDVFVPIPPCESIEDDGAIPIANPVNGFGDDFLFVAECFGTVGDGPQAEVNGDVDFFTTRPLPADQVLLVDFCDFFEPTNAGALTVGFYNAEGNLLASGQDDPTQCGPDSEFFSIITPAEGVYHVAVGGAMPTDPNDPTTGTNTDIGSDYAAMYIVDANQEFFGGGFTDWAAARNGDIASMSKRFRARGPLAELRSAIDARKAAANAEAEEAAAAEATDEEPVDTDFYLVHLRKGDAIAGGFDNARSTGIIDPDGVLRSASPFNPSFIYPLDSPLRHDRRTGFDHVATVDGVHAVFVTDGIAEYEGELRVVRSGLAPQRNRGQQIIFLDFDGATVSGDTWGTGVDANLSPLSAFLAGWGLGPADEDDVIDATIDAVIETLDHDLRVLDGRNGDRDATNRGTEFDVEVLNSRDHGDRWGDPNVSRVVIGGTIEELLIPTIGIAQSIDPGNTETEETAVVLLDIMSLPAGETEASINSYGLADGVSKASFVGFVVGHITAHEIGHYIGNWHQETFNEVEAVMDAGGDFAAIAGVGDDGVFGTADDTDPDFVEDIFNLFEGFSGVEDTAGRSVFALSTGQQRVPGPPNRPGGRR
ncbi:MAG: hypothetical protein OES24_20810 [Acidimicrobiia bacterium]|nr:hypothetical protein [Acidimicrobiia bacterium]